MLRFLNQFFISQLIILHTGVWYAKIKASFMLGAAVSPFAFLLQQLTNWYITNQLTIFIVSGAIIADWISGIWKHLKLKTFSIKLNGIGLLTKTGMVVLGSFLAEGLGHYTGNDNVLSTSLITILRLSIFMYPAGSCWMNIGVITNGVFPPMAWINRIKSFNQNLSIKDLTDGNKG